MRKVKFYSDQSKPSLQKKVSLMPWYNNRCKEAKKLRNQFIYALEFFGTLVTPISEYGIELGALTLVYMGYFDYQVYMGGKPPPPPPRSNFGI